MVSKTMQIFDFEDKTIRVSLGENDDVYFVAADLARALNYRDAASMLRIVDDEEKGKHKVRTPGGDQMMLVVNEAGFYRIALNRESTYVKDPQARAFVHRLQHWVTGEVLPSIRKHGGYLAGQEYMSPEEMVAASMRYLESKIAEQKRQLDAQKPKVALAEAIGNSTSTILIGELAKILTQNGAHNLGTRRLFERLRADGYLCRQHGEMWNLPTQRAMDMGLFEVIKRPVAMPDGSVRVTRTTKVTGRGQEYFINRYITKEN